MPLAPGARLGVFEVRSTLGVGGMGEVYRAHDTSLGRDVALKILPEAFATHPGRLARFEREAHILASLDHAHIATVYGLAGAGELRALVLELVEGPTLAERIAAGPLPVGTALPIARQIAEALQCAHEKRIVHRDLKPANIKLRADGTVKVLDFGLAKALEAGGGDSDPDAPHAPATLTAPGATQAGDVLGTAAYMSPEQARGEPVDPRADLWAFGVVLYEMLTGTRPFAGRTMADSLAAGVTPRPDWTSLPADTPAAVRRLLRRCLASDRRVRLDSAAVALLEIEEASDASSSESPSTSRGVPRSMLAMAGAVAAALAVVGILASRGAGERPPLRLVSTIAIPAGHVVGDGGYFWAFPTRTPFTFTPDGRSLVVQAKKQQEVQLFLRPLDRADATPIPGTTGAQVPFVSPDGKWVGFWAAGHLRKVPIEGGPVATIAQVAAAAYGPYGAAWSASNTIVYGDEISGRVWRVSAGGGTPAPVTAVPDVGRRHVSPRFLPDGRRILFTDLSNMDATQTRVIVQPVDGGEARTVMSSAADARLLPSGHLAFMRLGTLMTVAFDVERAEAIGAPEVAMDGVMQMGVLNSAGAEHTAAGMFDVSSLGALAFVRGPLMGPTPSPLVWASARVPPSSAEPEGAPPGAREFRRISPDGSRAIVAVTTPLRVELWVVNWPRNTWTLCRACGSAYGFATWAPDGRRVVVDRDDTLVTHTLEGSEPDEVLVREPGRRLVPIRWLADGRLVYESSPDLSRFEIRYVARGATAGQMVVPLGAGDAADVSPDGRWLAYRTQGAIVVQAFPGPGPRVQVSTRRTANPAWSADSRTLYYLAGGSLAGRFDGGYRTLMAVDVADGAAPVPGLPREVLRRDGGQGCFPVRCYDISSDARRFLFHDVWDRGPSVDHVELILDWVSTLPAAR